VRISKAALDALEGGPELRALGAPTSWPKYRKRVLTHAKRIAGPFTVETSEGTLTCKDGYLACDARGYPYPIDKAEFELIYEPA
jgi:hypothetical protein